MIWFQIYNLNLAKNGTQAVLFNCVHLCMVRQASNVVFRFLIDFRYADRILTLTSTGRYEKAGVIL